MWRRMQRPLVHAVVLTYIHCLEAVAVHVACRIHAACSQHHSAGHSCATAWICRLVQCRYPAIADYYATLGYSHVLGMVHVPDAFEALLFKPLTTIEEISGQQVRSCVDQAWWP